MGRQIWTPLFTAIVLMLLDLEALIKRLFVAGFARIKPPILNSCESSYGFCLALSEQIGWIECTTADLSPVSRLLTERSDQRRTRRTLQVRQSLQK